MGYGDFMGGGLDTVLARVREYRRWIEYRRQAAHASAYLDERDRATSGGRPSTAPRASGAEGVPPEPRFPIRRSLLSVGAAMMLALVAVTAITLGVSEINRSPQANRPYAAVDPTGAAPGSPLGAASTTPAAIAGAVPATPPAKTTAPAATATAASDSADAAPTGSASDSETPTASTLSVLDLCHSVVAAGTGWPSVVKGAQRAAVVAAAGKKNNVLNYCTDLVATTPSP